MSFTPINTEDEFNTAIQERLNRERSKFSDYDDLKEKASKYEELLKADWEKKAHGLEDDLAKARADKTAADDKTASEKARADKAEQELLRYKVSAKYKLPSDLSDRIKGTTEEEMEKDAEQLSKLLGTGNPTPRFHPDPKSDPYDKNAAKTAALRGLLHDLDQQ